MLSILVNNQYIDLDENTSVSFTLRNPIFDADGIARSYSFPFSVPMTDRNQRIFNYAHRIDASTRTEELPAKIYLYGLPYEKGIIAVEKGTENRLKISFKSVEIDFIDQISDLNIHEILETLQIPPTGNYIGWRIDVDLSGNNFMALTILDEVFQYQPAVGETAAQAANAFAELINETFPGLAEGNPPFAGNEHFHISANVIEPVLLNIQSTANMTVTYENTKAQENIAAFRAFADALATTPDERVTFPSMRNLKFYAPDTQNYSYRFWVNACDNAEYLMNEPRDEKRWQYTQVPMVRLLHILQSILDETTLNTYRGNDLASNDFQGLIFYDNYALDKGSQERYHLTTPGLKWHVYPRTDIDLNKHVPEMSAQQFLQQFRAEFEFYMTITDNDIEFKRKVDMLKPTPTDWTKKATPAYELTKRERKGITISHATDPEDPQPLDGYNAPYVLEGGERDIEIPFGTLPMTKAGLEGGTKRVPISAQLGKSDLGTGDAPKPTPRILIYREFALDSTAQRYPYASSDNLNVAENVAYPLSLQMDTPFGLYAQCYQGFAELEDRQPITKTLVLTIKDLLEVRKWENARRRIAHPQGEFTGVIKQIQFKATPTGISESKIEFIQC